MTRAFVGKTVEITVRRPGTQQNCVGGCRQWYDGDLTECPHCGRERPGYSKSLMIGRLNENLYEGVRRQHAEQDALKRTLRERP